MKGMWRILVMVVGLVVAEGIAVAGVLDPPGPPASTGKTLLEVEPRIALSDANTPGDSDSVYRITLPGSYYLTEELVGPAGFSGIKIIAHDVSIDLMGYSVTGSPGSLDGIRTVGTRVNLRISNGSVVGWGQDGIDLTQGGMGTGSRVERVEARGNGARGIRVNNMGVVSHCSAIGNGTDGISGDIGLTVDSCVVRENLAGGIIGGFGAIVSDCLAQTNGGAGIFLGWQARVIRCTVTGSASSSGIIVGNGCLIMECVASNNSVHGIQTGSICTIQGNVCDGNGTASLNAGIFTSGQSSRIEGNRCGANQRGIRVTGSHNLIVGNACSASLEHNFDIAAHNRYGPIVDIRGNGPAAALGSSAPGTLTTTDPHANFAY